MKKTLDEKIDTYLLEIAVYETSPEDEPYEKADYNEVSVECCGTCAYYSDERGVEACYQPENVRIAKEYKHITHGIFSVSLNGLCPKFRMGSVWR